jgi:hypothetical protein
MCGRDSCGSPKVVILNVGDHRDQIVIHFDVPPRESRTEIVRLFFNASETIVFLFTRAGSIT